MLVDVETFLLYSLVNTYSYTLIYYLEDNVSKMTPMQKAPKISVLPAAGVMATSPATAPVQAPTVVGFLFTIQSISIQVVAAAAVAIWITRKALAATMNTVCIRMLRIFFWRTKPP